MQLAKHCLVVAVAVAALAAGCGDSSEPVAPAATTGDTSSTATSPTDAARGCGDRMYGAIRKLTPSGDDFVVRFDPAWFLGGDTANIAAAEDGVVQPGEPVPNDYYILDEGRRLLTFRLPRDTPVTVLTVETGSPTTTTIDPAELAKIVAGTSTLKPLSQPAASIWLSVRLDTICAVEQQYRP